MCRELKEEEADLDVKEEDLEFVLVQQRKDPISKIICYDFYFAVGNDKGEPKINESDKCSEMACAVKWPGSI
ncbi:MAG: hypothetical protein HUJ55_08925 [Ileibacterium sp.]|nr:hypothetical protein [Ileibacterium sp.]